MWRLLKDSCCHEILPIDIEKYLMPFFHQITWKHLFEMKLESDRNCGRKIVNKSFVSN